MKESIAYQYQELHILGFLDCMKYIVTVKKYSAEHIKLLRKMPYSEYLKTTHWAMLKKAALSIAAHSCAMCHKNDTEIHVHHICYDNRGHEDVYKDVECLCAICHKGTHDIVNTYLKQNMYQLLNSKVMEVVNEEIYPFNITLDNKAGRFGLNRFNV